MSERSSVENVNTIVITPPNSPQRRKRENNANNTELASLYHLRWFNCLGEVNQKDRKLHVDGYINTGEIEAILTTINSNALPNRITVKLFGRSFDFGSALLLNNRLLFSLAKKELMILDTFSRAGSKIIGNSSSGYADSRNYMQLRKNICELMTFIRCYLSSVLADESSYWLFKSVIPPLKEQLSALRLMLKNVRDLPDYIVSHGASNSGNKCTNPAYHLYHLHLDLRWYHLTLLKLLARCQTASMVVVNSQQNDKEESTISNDTFEKHVLLLLSDLLHIGINRFEKIPVNSYLRSTPFSCTCVKEFWLMLILLLDKLEENGKSFWTYMNETLNAFLKNSPPTSRMSHSCSELSLPATYSCSNPALCSLWVLAHVSYLYGYADDGKYRGSTEQIASNYLQLESILKSYMLSESNVTEQQLRVIVLLVSSLVTEWWGAKSEPVMILWEYYYRKLNSAFFIAGAPPDSIAIMSKTASGLLEQVKDRLIEHSCKDDLEKESSFSLFLRLLGRHLVRCFATNQQRQWQQMKGRIYSKFSPNKMLGLTEMGLYHFVSLFLTLTAAVEPQEIGQKMQDLLSSLPLNAIDMNKQNVIMKGNLALVQYFVEKGLDVEKIVQPLLVQVKELCKQKGKAAEVMKTFVEGFQDIIDMSPDLNLSQYCLIDNWIMQHLSHCSVSESCHLLDVLLSTMSRLRQTMSQVMGMESLIDPQSKKMLSSLCSFVLPYVETQYCNTSTMPPFQVADLAASFTLLALEHPGTHLLSFSQLFLSFATSEKTNIRLLRRYLCHILPEENTMTAIVHHEEHNYESIIIQAWIRCCILSVDESCEEISELTRSISRLPAIEELCILSASSLVGEEDAVITFIRLVGRLYEGLQNAQKKLEFHEKYSAYFENVDKTIATVINSSTSSSELINRVYNCCANMIYHCGSLLYIKSKPNCLLPNLINLLVLPLVVYKPETQLHPFIACALRRTLHHFLFGLAKLDPKNDRYIERVMKDIVAQYLHRLTVKQGGTSEFISHLNSNHAHPLLHTFTEEHQEIGKLVLDTITERYITCRGSTPHDLASLALAFVLEVLKIKRNEHSIISLVMSSTLLKIFEISMLAEEASGIRKQAMDILKMITNCNHFRDRMELRRLLISILTSLCNQHLAFSSSHLFKLLICLATVCPSVMTEFYPQLKDAVKAVERRRGVGYDPGLRNGLSKISSILGLEGVS